eukprot:NODE_84_length_22349_cov_0.357888.p10 type:complete len:273 gc:universal NODE_84_length_22349_cov_0.357888:16092-16910(+)
MSHSFKEANQIAKERIETTFKSPREYNKLAKQIREYLVKSEESTKVLPLSESLKAKPRTTSAKKIEEDLGNAAHRKNLMEYKTELRGQITLLTVVSLLNNTKNKVEAKRVERIQVRNKVLAAEVIAKWYRKILIRRREAKRVWAIATILPQLLRFGLARREIKRQKYALIVYNFIQESFNSGILINLVHAYQTKVVNCQGIIRVFLAKNKAKFELRVLQVEQYERKTKKRYKTVIGTSKTLLIKNLMKEERKRDSTAHHLLFTQQELSKHFD